MVAWLGWSDCFGCFVWFGLVLTVWMAWLVSLVPVAWLGLVGWLAGCFVCWSDCILAFSFWDLRPTNQSTNQPTNHVEALARESPRDANVDSKEYEEAT